MSPKKNQPLVSICIPTYNNARYLRECLDSIVAQTYSNLDIIVGDDGSSDSSLMIAREYEEKFGIRVHRNANNLGAAATSAVLVGLAKGHYVSVYHSDDVYDRTIVEKSVHLLEADRSIGFVGTMASIIDSTGRQLGEFKLHETIRRLNKRKYTFDEFMLGVLKNGGSDIMIVTPSVMARKEAYDILGPYSLRYKGIYDYEMWFRMASRYAVGIIDEALMCYRIHENQISQRETSKSVDLQEIVLIIREYRHFIEDNNLRNYCDSLIDKWVFRSAKKQNYRGLFQKSTETLELIESQRYLLLKRIIRMLNRMRIRLRSS